MVKTEQLSRSSKPRWSKLNILLVGLYLLAVVLANLSVAYFGVIALIVTAWFLIPFDLCARDVLHESWQDGRLLFKIALLIVSGSLLSWLIFPGSNRVAVASCVAFLVAGWIDTGVYQLAHHWPRAWRMNLSNLFSAVTDSIIFPVIAFGTTTLGMSAGQAGAKFCGGIFWTWIFIRWIRPRLLPEPSLLFISPAGLHEDPQNRRRSL